MGRLLPYLTGSDRPEAVRHERPYKSQLGWSGLPHSSIESADPLNKTAR
jgi:hypothetical protein